MASTRVILYSGKGGTGKSVISCATALKLSELGYETLLVSSDPAHTLSDAFGVRVGSELTKVGRGLWAIQIDPIKEVRKSYSPIQDYIASVFSAKGVDETVAYEIAILPGATSLFAMLNLEAYIKEGRFDAVILDTIPSGEALRFLYFPKLFGTLSRRLIELAGSMMGLVKLAQPLTRTPTPSKQVLKSEVELIERLERLGGVLSNPSITSLRLIANPDAFSVENVRRSLMTASLYGINVDLCIINKILPSEVNDPYFTDWLSLQSRYVREAEAALYPIPVKKLHLYSRELKGVEMLKTCAEDLFPDEDPIKVYFQGAPFKFTHTEDSLTIIMKIPFATKKDCEVERVGMDLMVKVETDIGSVMNIIPLPAIAYGMRLAKAKLLNDELHIIFEKDHEA